VNKHQIRRKILKLRKQNSNKIFRINLKIFFSFLETKNFRFKNIGGYFPTNFEIDDLQILEFMENKNYRISLPVIKKNYKMDFFKWSINDPLKINKFGIPEPTSSIIVYPDIILVPLVSYDNKLNRLGYGGGFYDRYLQNIEKVKKIVKIGLAFSYQNIKKIPINKFDKKLDFIITEKKILS
tara:strand:- start:1784 stop:2329 length:546 start_codon:yes stop_codon:yes gene_type:complete